MATLKQMLDKSGGNIHKAEEMAKWLISEYGDKYLLDLSLLYSSQGKKKEALELCYQYKKAFPTPQSRTQRADHNIGGHLIGEDLLKGFTLTDKGREENLWGSKMPGFTQPVVKDIPTNKYILFYCEAGYGDQIIFIRFAKQFSDAGNKVIAACSPGLMSVFARLPYLSSIVSREGSNIYFDCYLPSMGSVIPLKLNYTDLDGSPYLIPDPKYVEKFKPTSNKLKVGINWHGQSGDDFINRVFPTKPFFEAVSQEHVQLYSLQKNDDPSQVEDLPQNIIDLEPELNTWEDTIGVITHLDLVITSCTAIAHVSAALGKPTWVIVPVLPYFIWAYPGNKSLWYDSVTLFRQEKYGTWDFSEIEKKLSNYGNL